jgi:hypothetical protein
MVSRVGLLLACVLAAALPVTALAADGPADLILHNGKIATVDKRFSVHEAIAVRGERILAVGSNQAVLKTKGENTRIVDLGGKTVLPGLIDSHVHPTSACMTEFDHEIPDMETIQDVLDYVAARAKAQPEGTWITVRQVFITRLREQRYPTRAELDQAAPKHPVVFSTGPDAMANSLALQKSGIDKDFQVSGTGYIEKDPQTGEPTGMLRSCTRYLKIESQGKRATAEQRLARLKMLVDDYNSVGITAVCDRDAGDDDVEQWSALREAGRLTLRVALSRSVDAQAPLERIQERIRAIAGDPLRKPNTELRTIGIKTYLDGGMLTGSAYMREPWGKSEIYSIRDPEYRGVLFIPREKLLPIVQATVDAGLQFTAHSVGDGAVHQLLDVYEEINRRAPIAKTRPSITHSNFMSYESATKLAKLGVVVDIQPAWLYLDTRTLVAQFGYDRLRYFQPLRTIFESGGIAGGGSDHMQEIGSLRSVNPYNPFLGMWTTMTRRGRLYEGQLHPEEALTREQALRFYTHNNAQILFWEDQIGSLEEGKLADMIVVSTDFLKCPVDEVRGTQVLETYLGGRVVYERR